MGCGRTSIHQRGEEERWEQRLGCCRFKLEFFGEHEGTTRKDGLAVVMDRRATGGQAPSPERRIYDGAGRHWLEQTTEQSRLRWLLRYGSGINGKETLVISSHGRSDTSRFTANSIAQDTNNERYPNTITIITQIT